MAVTLRPLFEIVGLVTALGFVFLSGFIPHLDTASDPLPGTDPSLVALGRGGAEFATDERPGYPYALHVDEHVHWARMAQMQRQDTAVADHPYTGSADPEVFRLRGTVHEEGYLVVLSQVQELTGVSWLRFYQIMPAAWLAFTAFCVYAALRPHAAALPAAAFVGLVPTTIRFLGPAFLVPIGFSLAWLPVVVILADPARRRFGSAVLLGVVLAWTFFVHLVAGFAAVALVALYGLAGGWRDARGFLALAGLALLPVGWLWRSFTADVSHEIAKQESLPIDVWVFFSFGALAMLAWAAGLMWMAWRPPSAARRELATFALGSVVFLSLIVGSLVFDLNRYATYARWHPVFFLCAAVGVGFFVARVARLVPSLVSRVARAPARGPAVASGVFGVVLVGLLLSPGVAAHLNEPYYRVVDHEEWRAFHWVERNLGPEYEVFLAEPWGAPVLAAVSGRLPHAYLLPGSPPVNGVDWSAYEAGRLDLAFFVENDITFVVGPVHPGPEEFSEVAPNVWALDPAVAKRIAEVRAAS